MRCLLNGEFVRNGILALTLMVVGDANQTVQSQDAIAADPSAKSDTDKETAADEDEIPFPVEMGNFRVSVVDANGNPIVGAEVEARGARCAEDPGSGYGWPTPNAGKKNTFTTDKQGQVEFQYPIKFGTPPDYRTLTVLFLACQHSEFITVESEIHREAGKWDVVMKPGCKIEFSAVDEFAKPIDRFGALVAQHHYTSKWDLENGILRSSAVPDGQWQTMLVAPIADGRTLFSGVLPARYVTGQPFTIRNVILTPGLQVEGRLSDDVPRPVEDGVVVAFCQPKPTPESIEAREAIDWGDSATITPEGTFHFKSLPRTGRIQLIAICRGWVCVDEPREGQEKNTHFKTGRLLKLSELPINSNVLRDVELRMEKAGTIEVCVRKLDGSPLAGMNVSTWPNQMLESSGSQLLGTKGLSLKFIETQLANQRSPNFWLDRESRYIQETDERGIVVLHDVPIGSQQSIVAGNDKFQPVDNGERFRATSITLDSPELRKIEIIVEPIAK